MDLALPDHCKASGRVKVMVQHAEGDTTLHPSTTLPGRAANRGAAGEPIVSPILTPIKRGLHVSMSPVKTAAHPAEPGQVPVILPAAQTSKLGRSKDLATGPALDGGRTVPTNEVPSCDTEAPPSCKGRRKSTNQLSKPGSLPASPGTPLHEDHAHIPPTAKRKPGRKSKAELMLMRNSDSPPPGNGEETFFTPPAKRKIIRKSMAVTGQPSAPPTPDNGREEPNSAPPTKRKVVRKSMTETGQPSAPPTPDNGREEPNSAPPTKRKVVRKSMAETGQPSAPPTPGNGLGGEEPNSAPPTKRKAGRKSKAEIMLMSMVEQAEALTPEEPDKRQEEPKLPEVTPSGRPRRQAAKAALQYLHDLAEVLSTPGRTSPSIQEPSSQEPAPPTQSGKKGKKRKSVDSDDDGDADFVLPEALIQEEEEEEEREDAEEEDASDMSEGEGSLYNMSVFSIGEKPLPLMRGLAQNGFHNSIMAPTWRCAEATLDFRNLHHSDWEFADWIPCKESWRFLSHQDAESYLPLQPASPPFTIQREGLREEAPPCILHRFRSLPPHPQRCDSTIFVGGPVWAMEWCPSPAGSGACQYLALYCHRGMDDRHSLQATHTGPAMVQLWRMGALEADGGSACAPSFSYGLALDEGCVWDMKFCPSGGWELPSTSRKSSQMARLGLLATAFSSGHVEIYSLPHPESLASHRKSQVKDPWELSICKVDCVLRLQVGSIKASKPGENGQCFSLAWLHTKPHQYLAAGFYDGTVAIWDLKTKSVLQKVRQGHTIKQYPFLSFSAHNNAVQCIEWCKVDSNFLVTSGGDRRLRFWDLRRLAAPVNDYKRFHTTELAWLLPYCGVVVAQDNCYASHGLCGLHYVDSGFLGFKPYLAAPRRGTVWSVSGSDWLGTVTAGDITGEVMAIIMPALHTQCVSSKRPSDRRFPVYKVDFLSFAPPSVDGHSDGRDLPSGPLAGNDDYHHIKPKSFRAADGRFSLLFQDTDMRDFHNMGSKESTKRMNAAEMEAEINIDRVSLEAIHKVRFSPNLDTYTWLASGGHSGLVRVHCVRGMASSVVDKMVQEKRTQFQAMYEPGNAVSESDFIPEVQHCVVPV